MAQTTVFADIKFKTAKLEADLPSELPLSSPIWVEETEMLYVGQGPGKPLRKVGIRSKDDIVDFAHNHVFDDIEGLESAIDNAYGTQTIDKSFYSGYSLKLETPKGRVSEVFEIFEKCERDDGIHDFADVTDIVTIADSSSEESDLKYAEYVWVDQWSSSSSNNYVRPNPIVTPYVVGADAWNGPVSIDEARGYKLSTEATHGVVLYDTKSRALEITKVNRDKSSNFGLELINASELTSKSYYFCVQDTTLSKWYTWDGTNWTEFSETESNDGDNTIRYGSPCTAFNSADWLAIHNLLGDGTMEVHLATNSETKVPVAKIKILNSSIVGDTVNLFITNLADITTIKRPLKLNLDFNATDLANTSITFYFSDWDSRIGHDGTSFVYDNDHLNAYTLEEFNNLTIEDYHEFLQFKKDEWQTDYNDKPMKDLAIAIQVKNITSPETCFIESITKRGDDYKITKEEIKAKFEYLGDNEIKINDTQPGQYYRKIFKTIGHSNEKVHEIHTVEDFKQLANSVVLNSFEYTTFKLMADLDFSGEVIHPVNTPFFMNLFNNNSFDGNGFAIKNVTYDNNSKYDGAFFLRNVEGSTIKNLTFENVNLINGSNSGIIGKSYELIENVHFINCRVESKGANVGMISSSMNVVKDCTVSNGTIVSTDFNAKKGILLGYFKGAAINCHVKDSLIDAPNSNDVGGLIGYNNSAIQVSNCSIENTTVKGKINVGGLLGRTYNSYKPRAFHNCFVNNVTVDSQNDASGFIGEGIEIQMDRCYAANLTLNGITDNKVFISTLKTSSDHPNKFVRCFYDSTQYSDSLGIAKTLAELKQLTTYDDFNKDEVWDIVDGSLPKLKQNPLFVIREDIFDGEEIPKPEFALYEHNHDEVYAPATHNHDGTYAPTTHNHDGRYAPATHNHDGMYAPATHSHDGVYISMAERDKLNKIIFREDIHTCLTRYPISTRAMTLNGDLAEITYSNASTEATKQIKVVYDTVNSSALFYYTFLKTDGTAAEYVEILRDDNWPNGVQKEVVYDVWVHISFDGTNYNITVM